MGAYRELLRGGWYPVYVLPVVTDKADTDGIQYSILAGPAFTVVYTFAGLPIGYIADRYNRKNILAFAVLFWSGMTALSGISKEFWQKVLSRAGLGIGEAACTPLAQGILADYFHPELRGTANGVYNWGIYTGYSLAQGVAGYINTELGQEWAYFIAAMPGALVAALIWLTVREPERGNKDPAPDDDAVQAKAAAPVIKRYGFVQTLVFFGTATSLLLLCFAGSIRNGAGTVWANYTVKFFNEYRHRSKKEIASYMGWIPLVGGSLGAVFGGFISDRIVKKRGPAARVWVLVVSQFVAAPFALGALLMPSPYSYLMLIGSNIVGEMWVGVTLTIVIELVPLAMRVSAVALYLFIISNIASLMVLLEPAIQHKYDMLTALIILYPGCYALSAVLFLLVLASLNRDIRRKKEKEDILDASNQPLLYGTSSSIYDDLDQELGGGSGGPDQYSDAGGQGRKPGYQPVSRT